MKKVLIVDDTKNIRTLLTTCLELYGYETVIAKNGQEALEIIKNKRIDLAFLDIKMPEISGTEVLRKIRAMNIDIPVIIMTAFGTVKNAVECTRMGAVEYLQKPFTADRIKSVLSELEEKSRQVDNISNNINLAKELIEKSDVDEALKILKNLLVTDIEYSEVYYLIGKVYELKGDIKKANAFYTMSQQIN